MVPTGAIRLNAGTHHCPLIVCWMIDGKLLPFYTLLASLSPFNTIAREGACRFT